jgi:glycerol kinase
VEIPGGKCVVALDVGSTSSRALAVGRSGAAVTQASRPMRQTFPQPGWVEHDAEAIWNDVLESLREVLGRVGPRNVAALGITNQRETFVLWDRESGRPLHPAISWQCRRTAERCAALKKESGKLIKRTTGLPVDPYFSATKLEWVLDRVKGARAAAEAGRLAFGTLDTWLLWKLTKGRVHATEPGNASRTMLMDLRSQSWSPALLRLFRVPASLLPEIRDSAGIFGETDPAVAGLCAPVTALLGDQQASLFSQGGWDPSLVVNTYGTGMVAVRSTGVTPPLSSDLVGCAAWRVAGRTDYCEEGPAFIAGAALQWLRESLGVLPDAATSQAMALSLPSNEGVYFVPAFSGLGTPHWDPDARGLLIGLTRGTGPAHLARAALESIAYQVRDILEAMEDGPARLRACGGVAANDFLMQFQADVLGIPVERPANLESTALGAAALAGAAAGLWTREEFAAAQEIQKVFRPKMKKAERESLYRRWREAVEKTRGWGKP